MRGLRNFEKRDLIVNNNELLYTVSLMVPVKMAMEYPLLSIFHILNHSERKKKKEKKNLKFENLM